jgi:hypothetical protein
MSGEGVSTQDKRGRDMLARNKGKGGTVLVGHGLIAHPLILSLSKDANKSKRVLAAVKLPNVYFYTRININPIES